MKNDVFIRFERRILTLALINKVLEKEDLGDAIETIGHQWRKLNNMGNTNAHVFYYLLVRAVGRLKE